MPKLEDIIAYLLVRLPERSARVPFVTQLLYLADWRSAISNHHQLTDLGWRYGDGGAEAEGLEDAIRLAPALKVAEVGPGAHERGDLVSLREETPQPQLSDDEERVLEVVLRAALGRSWPQLLQLSSSTYPLLVNPQHTDLDLPTLAAEYREVSEERESVSVGR